MFSFCRHVGNRLARGGRGEEEERGAKRQFFDPFTREMWRRRRNGKSRDVCLGQSGATTHYCTTGKIHSRKRKEKYSTL